MPRGKSFPAEAFCLVRTKMDKKALVSEVHHRMKNNLQTIASLLRLQARHAESSFAKEALYDAINRILSMAIVHDLLSHQPHETVSAKELTTKLVALNLENALLPGQTIKTRLDVQDISLNSEKASLIGLLVNELVHNSVKHAFPGNRSGEIHVALNHEGNNLHLTVEDNGIGFPVDFSVRSSSHLGLKIVENIVAKDLNGEFQMENLKGVRCVMKFPLSGKHGQE